MDRLSLLEKAEADGRIADSGEVRLKLIQRVTRGEITLDECQAELRKIKQQAKSFGMVTRSQAWNGH